MFQGTRIVTVSLAQIPDPQTLVVARVQGENLFLAQRRTLGLRHRAKRSALTGEPAPAGRPDACDDGSHDERDERESTGAHVV